jgi:LPS sulfotransferase NodH
MDAPLVTYIIASTMRTGSYLLCEGLEATGRAGHPQEIFCPERRGQYTGNWKLPADIGIDAFIRAAFEKGTTENGVLGTKIHAHHVEPLARECGLKDDPWRILSQIFPAAKYIHLRRRNRRAQAISWYRAEITNEWWRIPGVYDWELTGRQPEFDAQEIRRLELELGRQQESWDVFFAANPVEVLVMDYETLAADYRGEVARALAFIGEDPELARHLPEPRMVRQSDSLTEDWQRRLDSFG